MQRVHFAGRYSQCRSGDLVIIGDGLYHQWEPDAKDHVERGGSVFLAKSVVRITNRREGLRSVRAACVQGQRRVSSS